MIKYLLICMCVFAHAHLYTGLYGFHNKEYFHQIQDDSSWQLLEAMHDKRLVNIRDLDDRGILFDTPLHEKPIIVKAREKYQIDVKKSNLIVSTIANAYNDGLVLDAKWEYVCYYDFDKKRIVFGAVADKVDLLFYRDRAGKNAKNPVLYAMYIPFDGNIPNIFRRIDLLRVCMFVNKEYSVELMCKYLRNQRVLLLSAYDQQFEELWGKFTVEKMCLFNDGKLQECKIFDESKERYPEIKITYWIACAKYEAFTSETNYLFNSYVFIYDAKSSASNFLAAYLMAQIDKHSKTFKNQRIWFAGTMVK